MFLEGCPEWGPSLCPPTQYKSLEWANGGGGVRLKLSTFAGVEGPVLSQEVCE